MKDIDVIAGVNAEECKSKLIPELLGIIKEGFKSNVDYLKQMDKLKDITAKEWSSKKEKGLIYLN